MNTPLLKPEQHVLSTLEADGSRRWLHPKLSRGRLLFLRRIVAYGLIAIFTILPFIKIGGKPAILLNIPARQFTFFGFTFLPTDTVLLAIFMVGLLLSVFLFTALFGRVWCGWACPQTVYMEFVFRPIERLFDGTVGRGGAPRQPAVWRFAVRGLIYGLLCIYLANTFLAYFVGVDQLRQWVIQSPIAHPLPFLVMAFVTIAMMIDFCYFREQLCLIACPYGRLQSVLLDQNSLIVAYDQRRGEPRGKKRSVDPKSNLPLVGDCIDCGNCVTTCPTGIDIRHGLQMECINCTQCIDACNLVMQKIGRPPNLIRYSSQNRDRGQAAHLLRPRTVIYPLLLLGVLSAFVGAICSRGPFDVVALREPGNPYSVTEDGLIRNVFRIKITNRSDQPRHLTAEPSEPPAAVLQIREERMDVAPGHSTTFHADMVVPRDVFENGRAVCQLDVRDQAGNRQSVTFKLIGPYN
jgi:cytochrome c oxidase accessory protein FixG